MVRGRQRRVVEEGDVMTSTLIAEELRTTDRCDRCGAQAYVRVVLLSGAELYFCAHHGREHEAKLREIDATIHDETRRLVDTPGTAAPDER
jgi:ribosomal protein L37E